MIVIRLELWPRGDESQKRLLGVAQIANVGGTADLGDYDATIFKSPEYARRPGVWKRGQVVGFHRRSRWVGPWELLWLALDACGVGERARCMGRTRIAAKADARRGSPTAASSPAAGHAQWPRREA